MSFNKVELTSPHLSARRFPASRLALVALGAIGLGGALLAGEAPRQTRATTIAIRDGHWQLNGSPTYRGTKAEGLLMNVRMVNATFEDRSRPDFDADANTAEFVARIPDYVAQGVRAFTLNLQACRATRAR